MPRRYNNDEQVILVFLVVMALFVTIVRQLWVRH